MFNIITNVKNRNVIGNITLDELVEQLRNPSIVHKKIVDRARSLPKNSKDYDKIKKSLPCFVPNYTHDKYVKVDTIENSTGFIYIDVDYEIDIDFSKYSFIAASWKSLSDIGSGMLVALDNIEKIGTDLKTMRAIINDICNTLDIKPDKCAVSRDRLNVVGYDYNAYYNREYTKYNVSYVDNSSDKKVDIKENNIYQERLESDVHFYNGDLRLSNLEDFTNDLVFEDDELYKDLSENPIMYTEIYIPKSIKVGERNSRVFKIMSAIKALNPFITKERFLRFAKYINNNKCHEPMESEEIHNLCHRVFESSVKLYPNKVKKYPFNPIYTLTGRERTNIATAASRKKTAKKVTDCLIDMINNWDEKVEGKLTLKALSLKSGKAYKTILRRKELKDLVNKK